MIQTIYNINRALDLEPDRFKRMDMIRYLGKVEQQLRELERDDRGCQHTLTHIHG